MAWKRWAINSDEWRRLWKGNVLKWTDDNDGDDDHDHDALWFPIGENFFDEKQFSTITENKD